MCDDGLTFSPKHVGLLRLRAEVLLRLRHFAESAAGYRAALVQAFDATPPFLPAFQLTSALISA